MINLLGFITFKPANIKISSSNSFKFAKAGLQADTFQRSNTAENQSKVTCPISFTGKSNRLNEYKKITDSLNQTAENAQAALDKQLASDGWAGKTADAISILWNSKNRATLVQADIDTYKEQVQKLDSSIKEDKFTDKFKEMFDVDYNHSNIIRYGKKAKQFEIALTTECIAKYTEEKLSKNIQLFNKNSGKLQDISEIKPIPYATSGSIPYYNSITTKETIFKNMENSLIEVLGDKKVLDKVLSSKGLDCEKSSKEDLYRAYGYISNFIIETTKETAKRSLKGQTLSQIKEDSDKAYEKAYGTKNDIIARVDKYNASQKAGAACVKFIANVVLNTLGPSSVLKNVAYSVATSVAMDVADATSNDIDGDFSIKSAAINACLSGINGGVNQSIVNKYAGSVASKILSSIGIKSTSNVGSTLASFVVKEIVSKEGVKLPAYAIEAVSKSVIQTMAGIKAPEDKSGLSEKELENSMVVISEAMTFLAAAKDNGKLDKNITQKEMVSLLKDHITKSMKNDTEFNKWLNKNKSTFEQLLNQLVTTELPKFNGQLKV